MKPAVFLLGHGLSWTNWKGRPVKQNLTVVVVVVVFIDEHV